MFVPVVITLGILGAIYVTRPTGPLMERVRVKPLEVLVNASRYNSNAPGTVGKRVSCANDPVCDTYHALLDLGYETPVLVGSDDPDLSKFRAGTTLKLLFDVKGDLRADRERPPWMMFFYRDPAPTTARVA